jgi:hypothetical protein
MRKMFSLFCLALLILKISITYAQFIGQENFQPEENVSQMLNVLGNIFEYFKNQNQSENGLLIARAFLKRIIDEHIKKQRMVDHWLLREG